MTSTQTAPLRPRYYLVHDTPAGRRWAYPVPSTEGTDAPTHRLGAGRMTDSVRWVPTPAHARIELGTRWIISDAQLSEVTLEWTPSDVPGPWRKRPERPQDAPANTLWDNAPDMPDEGLLAHYGSWGCDNDDGCLRCQMLNAVYHRPRVAQEPRHHTFPLTDQLPLPGEPNPDPDRAWTPDDPSLVEIYGTHTRHLWPGQLPGFRAAVLAALEADPRTSYVWTDAGGRIPRGHLEAVVPIRWEAPRTAWVDRYGARGQKLRGRERVPRPIAHSEHTTLAVPEGLAGSDKAEAIARWDASVTEWVDRFIPTNRVVACDACDGHGYKLDNQ